MATTSQIHVLVAGFPVLADALNASGRFHTVHRAASTSELRDIFKSGVLPKEKSSLVLMFASNLHQDTPETLDFLAGRLSSTGWKVVILSTSASAKDLVYANPGAGYLEQPFSVNQVLGAIAGLGLESLDVVPNGFEHIYFDRPASPPAAAHQAAGAWVSTQAPQEQQPSPRPTPSQPPTQAPVQSSPTTGSWSGTAVQTAPQTTPSPVGPSTGPQGGSGWGQAPAQAPRGLSRPGQSSDAAPGQGRSLARPDAQGPIGRRTGTYQDFAPGRPTAQRRGFVITIASPKGGTGKSSLSANLAVYLGLSLRGTNRRVALIDANFQQADTGKLLNIYSPNITNVVKDEGSLVPERIEQYMVHRSDLNASFLLGPATPRDASPMFFNSRLYSQVVEVLRQNFDYILIDTPVAELYHDILRNFALPMADFMIVPITPAVHTLMNADAWLRTITQPRHQGGDDFDPEKIGVVLNQAQDGIDCDEDQVKRELYSWRFIGSVPMTKEWVRANNNNEFVATKNYMEINEAFSNILYGATGEELLLSGLNPEESGTQKRGLISRLRRRT